jgi:hypothetical protein
MSFYRDSDRRIVARPDEVRFWEKVSPEPMSGCWLWAGGVTRDGYGKLALFLGRGARPKQKHVTAHRYSFFLRHGRWPVNGLHSCAVPACVNWDHITDGTQAENVRQCHERGRHDRSGWRPKATAEQVLDWRRRYASGESIGSITKDSGLSRTIVKRAIRGKTYRRLSQEVLFPAANP